MIRCDFAGAGGMLQGIRQAGWRDDLVGVEYDAAAVWTARDAGHRMIHGDVREVSLSPLFGYTAGPPCQTFTTTGNGDGRRALAHLLQAADAVAQGADPDTAVAAVADRELDARSVLVLHPLTVIRDERPTFVVLEQVRTVRPVWERYAEILRGWGYLVDVHVWSSETYGAPQTRQRASLVAVLTDRLPPGTVAADLRAPVTHGRYHSHDRGHRDPELPPFVTIFDALGRRETLRSNYGTGGNAAARGQRTWEEPAPTVTSKIGRNKWIKWIPDTAPVERVTVREAAILQTFPADYPWRGNLGDQYQQVGNAVPPLVAQRIVGHILNLIGATVPTVTLNLATDARVTPAILRHLAREAAASLKVDGYRVTSATATDPRIGESVTVP